MKKTVLILGVILTFSIVITGCKSNILNQANPAAKMQEEIKKSKELTAKSYAQMIEREAKVLYAENGKYPTVSEIESHLNKSISEMNLNCTDLGEGNYVIKSNDPNITLDDTFNVNENVSEP